MSVKSGVYCNGPFMEKDMMFTEVTVMRAALRVADEAVSHLSMEWTAEDVTRIMRENDIPVSADFIQRVFEDEKTVRKIVALAERINSEINEGLEEIIVASSFYDRKR